MEQTGRVATHQRLLIRYLITILFVPLVFALIAAVLERFTTREFALFVWGLGCLLAWIGMSHSHARTCAASEMDEASKPGAVLKILPWLALLIAGGGVYYGIQQLAPTPMEQGSLTAAGVGFVWAVFRGSRSIARAGSARTPAPDSAGDRAETGAESP